MAARFADRGAQLLLGQAEFLDQPAETFSLFDRVQILPLEVLHQGGGHRLLVRHIAHQHRQFVQAGLLGGAPAPLAGDDLELPGLAGMRAGQERLQNAAGTDGFRQLIQRLGR